MDGRRHRELREDCQAVSEVLGQVLMIAIVVLACSSMAVVIFSDIIVNPPHMLHVDLQERIDSTNNKLYIFHAGGEAINLKDISIVLVNSTDTNNSEEFTSTRQGFNCNAANNILMLGDYIRISPTNISLGTDDTIMFFVYTPSQQVIQKVTLHS